MKNRIHNHTSCSSFFLIFLVMQLSSIVYGQQKQQTDENKFTIVIEKIHNGLKLVSTFGSAWKELTFGLNNYQTQAIDEWGMTETGKVGAEKDAELAHYLFIIMKTEKGIALKGLEGTSWTELSFSLNEKEKQQINRDGMVQ